MSSQGRRAAVALWLVLALPGLAQLALLASAVVRRFGYPYDLEWMEGGLLLHAQRIGDGTGIYVEPSVDFIPYLYTPLYPGIIAAFGALFGVTYQLGRAISVLSIVAIVALVAAAIVREVRRQDRRDVDHDLWAAWAGAALAAGLMAATYPWIEGWYDLVRADTLFLVMAIGGLLALRAWAHAGSGFAGHGRIAVAGAVLALSFFCKQTGVFFVAIGGVLLLVMNWRRVPIYVVTCGFFGLGGTWLINRASGGWFWTYIYQVHQVHDWNRDRFDQSFGNMLGKFPVMTAVIVCGLVAVGVAAATRRRLPRSSAALLYWAPVFCAAVVLGALSWGTQWAHFNAYMPAMILGGLAAGAAVPALIGSVAALAPRRPALPVVAGAVAAAALGAQLIAAWWNPGAFVPTAADRRAGDALIEHIRSIPGEVFIPYHNWYGPLAGKRAYVHRMGVMDMTYANAWKVRGLAESLAGARFSAVILHNRPPGPELAGIHHGYRLDDHLPDRICEQRELSGPSCDALRGRPRTYTGAVVRPHSVWIPASASRPAPGATALFDFESGTFEGWTIEGTAWGQRPITRPLPDQGPVRRYGGRYFASSMHGGDRSTGTLTSPPFEITGRRLTFRMSGGADAETLRAELHVGGQAVRSAANETPTERMREHTWDVAELAGKRARIVLVDLATGAWGHLNADEFWLWDE